MYLVKTTNGDKILNSADAVKSIKKEDIEKIYFLTEVNSKVITAMKREKIIYVERDYGSIGID